MYYTFAFHSYKSQELSQKHHKTKQHRKQRKKEKTTTEKTHKTKVNSMALVEFISTKYQQKSIQINPFIKLL